MLFCRKLWWYVISTIRWNSWSLLRKNGYRICNLSCIIFLKKKRVPLYVFTCWISSKAYYCPTGKRHTSISFFFLERWTILRVNFFRYNYEKELINSIVTPFFGDIARENDDVVRKAAIEFLLRFSLQCSNVYMEPMLAILGKVSYILGVSGKSNMFFCNVAMLTAKVLQTPFEDDEIAERCQRDSSDIQIVLKGLIEIFVVSIYQLPSSNAIKVLSMLVTFLQWHYDKPQIFESKTDIRSKVRECLV